MLRLVKWLLGYVRFSFSGGFCEGFVNTCYQNGWNIQSVRIESGVLYAECPALLYQHLRRAARENGGRLKVIKKSGLIFYLLPLRNRWGLFAGLLVSVTLVCFLGGFIWNIEVTGNETLSDTQLLQFLEGNGFYEGVYFKSVDVDRLENLMLSSFDEVAWVHINRKGTSARVEINEAVPQPPVADRTGAANVKATKDGVIVQATVYDGWQVVKKGEAVTKGDLLISGVYTGEQSKANVFVHARGEYIAQVEEPFSLTVSRTQQYKDYGAEKRLKSLLFFGLKLPLTFGSSKAQECDIREDYAYLKLNGVKLPVGVLTRTVRPYTVAEKELSDEELTALAQEEIEKTLQHDYQKYEILSRDITVTQSDTAAVAQGSVLCLENIGEEVTVMEEIKVDNE